MRELGQTEVLTILYKNKVTRQQFLLDADGFCCVLTIYTK